mgnify:CR=1 FL=1
MSILRKKNGNKGAKKNNNQFRQAQNSVLDLNLIEDEVKNTRKRLNPKREKEAAKASHPTPTASEKKPVAKATRNREFAVVTYFFVFLFVALIIYVVGFVLFESSTVINNAYNKRSTVYASRTIRGSILAADGSVLAETQVDDDGNETRVYPYGETFAHVVGYNIQGTAGVESLANYYLLRSHTFLLTYLKNEITGNKNQGDSVITTLDVDLQEAAYEALGDYNGAVVVLQPSTGKILAMVSTPTFDPNTLEEDWSDIVSDDDGDSVLLNRATQGLYPPGSIFKIFATVEYLRENNYDDSDFSYTCKSSYTVGSSTIHCYGNESHGALTLKEAFAESCNCAFASLAFELDLSSYISLVNSCLFNSDLPTTFSYSESSFSLSTDAGNATLMQTVIGQGSTLVSPFHMALVASAIANDGVLMSPYVVDSVISETGETVETFESEEYGQLFTTEDCKYLQEYMKYTVTDGTASAMDGKSYTAAGKTGSAEYSDDDDSTHAWFLGYASKDGYEDIAIAVVVEGAGSGGKYAVPVAEEVFDTYFGE